MTLNQQILQGDWNRLKGTLRRHWGSVTDDELEQARGNVDELVGLIQRKTGEAREQIESYIEDAAANGASAAAKAAEALRSGAGQVAHAAQHTAEQAADFARSGYQQTEDLIRRRPAESFAVCFGAGVITGVILGLLVRGK